MTKEEYKTQFKTDEAVGWHMIHNHVKKLYPNQEPRHYHPALHFMLGGKDPIDGVSFYETFNQYFHHHMVSYGMSELYYNEESVGKTFSKWGFEFTFRLKPYHQDNGDAMWAIEMMNNLARYVFESGRWFEEYQFTPANSPIRLNTNTDMVGLIFVPDPELGKIDTPHGEVSFLQMVGISSMELARLQENPTKEEVKKLAEEMRAYNPLLITDLDRKTV